MEMEKKVLVPDNWHTEMLVTLIQENYEYFCLYNIYDAVIAKFEFRKVGHENFHAFIVGKLKQHEIKFIAFTLLKK